MSQHHVEVFIDADGIGSRLICGDEIACSETKPDYLAEHGCAVREWYENDGPDLLDFPKQETFVAYVAVRCDWRGGDEDAELHLRPVEARP